MPEPKVTRSIQVPHELYRRLEGAARREGLSINAAITQAIAAWVEAREQEPNPARKEGEAR